MLEIFNLNKKNACRTHISRIERTIKISSILLLGLATLSPTFAAIKAPATLQELDQRLTETFAQRAIPGASVALIEDGKVVFLKGYGIANKATGAPVTPDTIFRAASISKSFTGIAAMKFLEDGKLQLNARLADLAPEIKFDNPWEKTHPVRLVHLLEHTSGWPDVSLRVEMLNKPGWTVGQGIDSASSEFVSRWKPGQFAVYSNAGPAVAGYVLEKLSGQSFASLERDQILRPMGMVSADFDATPELMARVAKSYGADGSETPYKHIIMPPSGSLLTNVRDLSKLVLFFIGRGSVDGHQILSPQSVDRIEHGEASLAHEVGFDGGYGLGNSPVNDQGVTYRGHNGEIDSFTAVYGYSAAQRTGYVVMANGGEGVDFKTPITRIIQTYLNQQHAFKPAPIFPIAQRDLASFAGFYRNVTPAKDLMRPYAELLGWSRVTVAEGKLVIGGRDYLPTDSHSFRRADRDQASLAFIEQDGNTYLLSGGFGDRKKEAIWRVVAYAMSVSVTLFGGVLALLLLPVWCVTAYRKKLHDKGGWLVRILPLFAFVSFASTLILPFFALESGIETLSALARPGILSILIFACSLAIPVFAASGLWYALRTKQASGFIRCYAGLTCCALVTISIYALNIGWIGLRTWTM